VKFRIPNPDRYKPPLHYTLSSVAICASHNANTSGRWYCCAMIGCSKRRDLCVCHNATTSNWSAWMQFHSVLFARLSCSAAVTCLVGGPLSWSPLHVLQRPDGPVDRLRHPYTMTSARLLCPILTGVDPCHAADLADLVNEAVLDLEFEPISKQLYHVESPYCLNKKRLRARKGSLTCAFRSHLQPLSS